MTVVLLSRLVKGRNTGRQVPRLRTPSQPNRIKPTVVWEVGEEDELLDSTEFQGRLGVTSPLPVNEDGFFNPRTLFSFPLLYDLSVFGLVR